ncbi:MAG: hypothetical protein KF744_16360 [Taibaiella sp.]|nr:hypothetical protein [Taibaiella sp.]
MTRQILLAFFWCSTYVAFGQHKYELIFMPGIETTIAKRGPHYKTEVSSVKFLKPISKTMGGAFNITQSEKWSYGIEVFYDEFDYGYLAESHDIFSSSGVMLASGDMHADDRIALLKCGIRMGRWIMARKKIGFGVALVPSLGYYKKSLLLNDTTDNSFWREPYPLEIQYNGLIPYQRQGWNFLLKTSIEAQYQWSKHFATSLVISYQQGFSAFVVDSVNIVRPFELSGPKEHKYWTSVNGSAVQWHLGFKYFFQ